MSDGPDDLCEAYDPPDSAFRQNAMDVLLMLQEAVENFVGYLDTPISRRKYAADSFVGSAVDSALRVKRRCGSDLLIRYHEVLSNFLGIFGTPVSKYQTKCPFLQEAIAEAELAQEAYFELLRNRP